MIIRRIASPSASPDIRVVANEMNVSVMIVDGVRAVGIANMDNVGDYWWLARLNVQPGYRNIGYGRLLADKLKELRGDLPIVVCPGGYDLTSKEQHHFYSRCGFVEKGDHMVYPDVELEHLMSR